MLSKETTLSGLSQTIRDSRPFQILAEYRVERGQRRREWELARSYQERWAAGEINYGQIVDEVEELVASEGLDRYRILVNIDKLDGSHSE